MSSLLRCCATCRRIPTNRRIGHQPEEGRIDAHQFLRDRALAVADANRFGLEPRTYFGGTANAVGRTLSFTSAGKRVDVLVAAVLRESPATAG
jgi:hypothetical protein